MDIDTDQQLIDTLNANYLCLDGSVRTDDGCAVMCEANRSDHLTEPVEITRDDPSGGVASSSVS